jgi:hypothetical protein
MNIARSWARTRDSPRLRRSTGSAASTSASSQSIDARIGACRPPAFAIAAANLLAAYHVTSCPRSTSS